MNDEADTNHLVTSDKVGLFQNGRLSAICLNSGVVFMQFFLPRGSFLTIISKGDMLARKCSQGIPLKFQDGTFDTIKFFTGSST